MRIDRDALADLARGAAFLGSGGGGDPYYGQLVGEAELARVGPISGREVIAGLRRIEQILGRPVDAVMPIEIGGGNGLAPLVGAAQLGIPIVDADGMGRAFPESQMAIFNIRGLSACPSVLTAACGSLSVIETPDNLIHERLARSLSVALGGIAHMVEYPLTGREAKDHAIGGSVSAAIAAGAAIRHARAEGRDPFEALFAALRASGLYPHAGVLFDGKIVDLERETRNGFSIGRVAIESFDGASRMELIFQNENLVARRDGTVCAMVPDLITVMDRETADSITTERLKYGQRVKIVGAAAPAMLREPHALALVGPDAFGFEDRYVPIEQLNIWTVEA